MLLNKRSIREFPKLAKFCLSEELLLWKYIVWPPKWVQLLVLSLLTTKFLGFKNIWHTPQLRGT